VAALPLCVLRLRNSRSLFAASGAEARSLLATRGEEARAASQRRGRPMSARATSDASLTSVLPRIRAEVKARFAEGMERWRVVSDGAGRPAIDVDELLDDIAAQLDGGQGEERPLRPLASARERGRRRLDDGVDLALLIREYGVLCEAILVAADQAGASPTVGDVAWLSRWVSAGLARAVEDYTTRREAELSRALEQVHARDEMVEVVSHDLKDPIGVIWGSAVLIERALGAKQKGGAFVKSRLEVIQRAARRMERLVTDLLDLARLDECKLPIVLHDEPVSHLLTQAYDAALPFAMEKGVLLETMAQDGSVRCDRERILQVLANLIGNALKFTPQAGRVEVSAQRDAGQWRFAVADTGCGVAAEEVPYVFDRFWQAPRSTKRGGAGLGLAIAKGIVEAHGGSIGMESATGHGATLRFTLPDR
jgi:signal transduction histidine kinase